MKKLLKSMFVSGSSEVEEIAAAKEEDFFGDKANFASAAQFGMVVQELSFEDYLHMMKGQEKALLM